MVRMSKVFLFLSPGLFVLFLAQGHASDKLKARSARSKVNSPTSASVPQQTQSQKGIASWYGREHHGRRTASGEVFNQHKLTAAHRTLPLGTTVRVTNLTNGKSVDVRINDRGPYIRRQLIDLSYAAARAIDIVKLGKALVEVRVTSVPR